MLKKLSCAFAVLICLLPFQATAQTYTAEMLALLSGSRKVDFHKYQMLPLPTTRFAIGTMYPLESTRKDFDLIQAGIYSDPNNWWTTISQNDKVAALRAIFRPGEAGSIDLQGRQTRPLSLEAVFPQIAAVLSSKGNAEFSKIHVTVTAISAYNRTIDWLELDDAVYMEHLISDSVVKHAQKRDFVMTAGDLILNGFEARLTLNGGDVQLKGWLVSALEAFVQQSKSPFELKQNEDGTYTLKAGQPVVAAVYLALPPSMPWAELGDRKLRPLATPSLLTQIAKAEQAGVVAAKPEN